MDLAIGNQIEKKNIESQLYVQYIQSFLVELPCKKNGPSDKIDTVGYKMFQLGVRVSWHQQTKRGQIDRVGEATWWHSKNITLKNILIPQIVQPLQLLWA